MQLWRRLEILFGGLKSFLVIVHFLGYGGFKDLYTCVRFFHILSTYYFILMLVFVLKIRIRFRFRLG